MVVDTSVLIDCLRGNEAAHQALQDQSLIHKEIFCSEISRAEIFAGMWPEESEHTRKFLDAFLWQDLNSEIAILAGELAFAHRDLSNRTSLADYIVAATAQRLEASLWTLNIKDFPMFKDIDTPY